MTSETVIVRPAVPIDESVIEVRGKLAILDVDLAGHFGVGAEDLIRAIGDQLDEFPFGSVIEVTPEDIDASSEALSENSAAPPHSPTPRFAFTFDAIGMASCVVDRELDAPIDAQLVREVILSLMPTSSVAPVADQPSEDWRELTDTDMPTGANFPPTQGDEKLFQMLMCGATVTAAASAAGISERTAYRRLAKPTFRRRLDAARDIVRDNVVQQLTDASADAVDSLRELAHDEDPEIRLHACRALLESLAKVQNVMLTHRRTVKQTVVVQQRREDGGRQSVTEEVIHDARLKGEGD
jgi:hypothetical protein